MYKEGPSPVVNINVLLFDPQKANIGVVGDVSHSDVGHQPAKKSQRQQ
jgi:hypothetical protein